MITLYEKTETNFAHNGICALDGHIINPVVSEELNGMYSLEFDYPARAPHAAKIVPERLVKCPVPDMDDQLFRITYHKKELSGITHFTAYHVFYDLVDNFIEDTFVVNKNGQGAITQLLGATQYAHPFTASSNIPTYENARIVRHNPVEVILGNMANGFMSRWGGEIIRDNFHIYMQLVRGSDNGVAIRDKKNLTGYTSDVDFLSICTRIMPQGFDGLFLPEKYVNSPRINQYLRPKIQVIKYDEVKAAEGQYADDEDAVPLPQALTMLRTLAAREFSVNRIDLPRASYSVAFAPLADTEEYKNFAALETVKMGDTVTVIHEEDGFEISARITGYKYDPLAKAYISVALGNYTPKFTDIAKDIKRIETGVNQTAAQANYALQSANGKNTNFYGTATPANARLGDLWFKENGDKLELWVYETREGVTGWFPLLTDLTQEEMKKDLAEAAALVEEAKEKAEEALEAGEAARLAGEDAKAAAEDAAQAGADALAAGQEALAAGQAAQSTADQAVLDAQAAVSKANQAFSDAASALNNASNAASQAAAANTTATSAYNKSVKSTAVTYAVGTSGVTAPASGWQTTVPATIAGQFLWTRTIITLQDNSAVTSYSVAKHGDPGTSGTPGPAGADGKGITSTVITYQASASGTTTPTGTWLATVPSVSASQYLWTRTVITYSDNTTSTSYSVGMMGATGAAGAKGTDGKGITSTVITYQASTSGTATPTGTWLATIPSVSASQYLWTRTVITYSDSTTSTSYSVGMMGATGAAGAKGADGKGISSTAITYQASTSGTATPTGTWLTTIPSVSASQYLWTRTVITYSDSTTSTSYSVGMMGAKGDTGATGASGKGISSTVITYQAGSSGTTMPTGTWAATIPTVAASQYLWTRTVITYTDSTTSTSYSVGMMGATGAKGADGKGITATAVTYQASASGTATPTGTWLTTIPSVSASQYLWTRTIITYSDSTTSTSYSVGMMGATGPAGKGISGTVITYQAGTSGTTVPTGTWATTIPAVAASQFLWTRTVITYTDNTTSTSYSVGMMGAKGDTGATGPAGTPAPTITMVRDQYYLSTSNTTQAGGSWLDTVPTWTSGKYYWTRVAATYSNGTTTYSTPVLADALNNSLVTALEAKTLSQTLQTTVSQHATSISLNASNITNLTGRMSTAEATLTVQAGQIASKANQTTVDTLTGRVTTAESTIIQNANSFTLSLEQHAKGIADLAGANIVQAAWQQGSFSTVGVETVSASHVRSGWLMVDTGKRYLLQTYTGTSAITAYGTATLFYYRADKTYLSQASHSSATTTFLVPANAAYLRIRFTTTTAPAAMNCYLLETATTSGFINLDAMSSMVKLQATTDTLLVTVSETKTAIGTPFKVSRWERGNLNTSTGEEAASNSYLRNIGYIDVTPGERFISQMRDGTSLTAAYYYYKPSVPYAEFTVPAPKQYGETITTGTYTNATIITYLNGKGVEGMSITGAVGSNPYTSSGDYLVIYRLPLEGREPPNMIKWSGMKDVSDNIVLLYTGSAWVQIGTVTTNGGHIVHEWPITDAQRKGITSDNIHIAFFSIKAGSYAGIYNNGTTPFNMAQSSNVCFLSYTSTASAVTVPANCTKMRVRVTTTILPDVYTGNVYAGTARQDYSKGDTLYSALLMQSDNINLRVSKNDVVNQINVSTEGILIAGNKIRITGTTTIDNAVIQTAMIANLAVSTAKIADLAVSTAKIAELAVSTAKIANAAITNAKIGSLAVDTAQIANAAITDAKIANLSAAKITTGTLSADRIAAGSITSAKLTIANGFITNAMIADATIASAKIAALDAGKITTGTLSAARIGAGTITADKMTTNFLQTLTGSSSIRITGTTISYYSGDNMTAQISSSGFVLNRDNTLIGRIGTNNFSGQPTWRGLVFDLEYAGNYMCWAWRETSTASAYTTKLTYYRSKLQNGMEKGFHFDDVVFLKGGLAVASSGTVVTNTIAYSTFSSVNYLCRHTSNFKAGVALGGSNLLLGSQGSWVDLNTLRAICAQLSGKRVYLPASSSGLGSWWDVTFPSMTTWST